MPDESSSDGGLAIAEPNAVQSSPTGESVSGSDVSAAAQTINEQGQPQGDPNAGFESTSVAPQVDQTQQLAELQAELAQRANALRGVSRERSSERDRANALQAELDSIRQATQQPEIPGVQRFDAPPEGTEFAVVPPHLDPQLGGLLYDKSDGSYCVGDPDNPRSWHDEETARLIMDGRMAGVHAAEMQREQAVAETAKVLTSFVNTMEQHGQKMRAQAMPFLTTPEDQAVADDRIANRAMAALQNAGITRDTVALDPGVMVQAAAILQQSVNAERDAYATSMRQAATLNEQAKATQPVSTEGYAAGSPGGQNWAKMDKAGKHSYFMDLAKAVSQ